MYPFDNSTIINLCPLRSILFLVRFDFLANLAITVAPGITNSRTSWKKNKNALMTSVHFFKSVLNYAEINIYIYCNDLPWTKRNAIVILWSDSMIFRNFLAERK